MGTQIAKAVGYTVVKGRYGYRLVDPDGNFLTFPQTSEEDAWSFAPPLDTWEGVGLVLKWLAEHGCYSFPGILDMELANTDDWPKAICGFALEATK